MLSCKGTIWFTWSLLGNAIKTPTRQELRVCLATYCPSLPWIRACLKTYQKQPCYTLHTPYEWRSGTINSRNGMIIRKCKVSTFLLTLSKSVFSIGSKPFGQRVYFLKFLLLLICCSLIKSDNYWNSYLIVNNLAIFFYRILKSTHNFPNDLFVKFWHFGITHFNSCYSSIILKKLLNCLLISKKSTNWEIIAYKTYY